MTSRQWWQALFAAWALAVALAAVPLRADDTDELVRVEAERIAAMDKVRPTVVAVFAASGNGGGSGVVISPDGYALSNFHVTKGAGDAMKCGLPDGSLLDAVIVGIDPTGDVALIKLFGKETFACAELGDSDLVQAGQWVFAMGNPFLLATDFQPTVTFGIVSGVHRYQYPAGTILEYTDCIQTDASINPGNSGGPLFNLQGQLIGINGRGSFEKRGRVNVGVGYAISLNQIKNFLGHLHSGRVVDHATLGARAGTDPDGRVVVNDILEESDAFRRGLRYGDEIVSFGGRPIGTVNGLKNVLGIFPKGWRVPLVYRRGGESHEIIVRLGGVHNAAELWAKVSGAQEVTPPDEQPKEKPDGEKPNPDSPPKLPRRMRPMPAEPKAEIPAIVKEHLVPRMGYANYYFNSLHQQRLWKAIVAAQGDFAPLAGPWTFKGELEAQAESEFTLDGLRVTTLLPGGRLQLDVTDDLTGALDPPDTGGLLAALYLWRTLLISGLSEFGETYYSGTVPMPGHTGLVDDLVVIDRGVECHFLVDPAGGRLLGLELFTAEDADPCELYLLDYVENQGRQVPSRMEVRYGNERYGVFHFKQIELGQTPALTEAP